MHINIKMIKILEIKDSLVPESEVKEIVIDIDGIKYSGILIKKQEVKNDK
jgi:hypothetical protein